MGLHQTAIGLKSIRVVNWKNAKILDVGCGDGELSYQILKRTNAKELVGADISELEIAKAKKIIPTILIGNRGLSTLMLEGVAIHPIGIKYDRRYKWKEIGYEQEMV